MTDAQTTRVCEKGSAAHFEARQSRVRWLINDGWEPAPHGLERCLRERWPEAYRTQGPDLNVRVREPKSGRILTWDTHLDADRLWVVSPPELPPARFVLDAWRRAYIKRRRETRCETYGLAMRWALDDLLDHPERVRALWAMERLK